MAVARRAFPSQETLCVLRLGLPGLCDRRPRQGQLGGATLCREGCADAGLPGEARRRSRKQARLIQTLCTQSFAKNAGLYNERVGALHFVGSTHEEVERIKSQLLILQRSEISNPPAYGAHLVTMILTKPELFEDWKRDVKTMSGRILEMREILFDLLNNKLKTPAPAERKDWGHVKSQIVGCIGGLSSGLG